MKGRKAPSYFDPARVDSGITIETAEELIQLTPDEIERRMQECKSRLMVMSVETNRIHRLAVRMHVRMVDEQCRLIKLEEAWKFQRKRLANAKRRTRKPKNESA